MLERLAEALPCVLQNNPGLAEQARRALLTIHVSAGPKRATVRLDNGRIAVEAGAKGTPDVTLTTTTEAWASYASAVPPVGFQSLNGMMRAGFLTARGNMLEFARHLLLIEEVFASVRPEVARAESASKPVGKPQIEDIVGRYLRLDLLGRPHRIYFEEAGPKDGVPLLCLHTAGADGRQWRGILNDAEVTRSFRVIAFDLPRHGKSSPPAGFERECYQLTTDLYVETVMAVAEALGLVRPVVMGCSIGGRAVLHLALRHSTYFRGGLGGSSSARVRAGSYCLPEQVCSTPDNRQSWPHRKSRLLCANDRDRGAPHDAAPPTPPGIRVTYLGGSIGLSFSICSRAFGFCHRQDRFDRSAAVRS